MKKQLNKGLLLAASLLIGGQSICCDTPRTGWHFPSFKLPSWTLPAWPARLSFSSRLPTLSTTEKVVLGSVTTIASGILVRDFMKRRTQKRAEAKKVEDEQKLRNAEILSMAKRIIKLNEKLRQDFLDEILNEINSELFFSPVIYRRWGNQIEDDVAKTVSEYEQQQQNRLKELMKTRALPLVITNIISQFDESLDFLSVPIEPIVPIQPAGTFARRRAAAIGTGLTVLAGAGVAANYLWPRQSSKA